MDNRANDIKLITPTLEYADEIMEYKSAMIAAGNSFDGCGNLRKCTTAKEWIDGLIMLSSSETCPDGMVTADTYLAIRKGDNRLVGIIDLRHNLNNPVLSVWGGHIGYSVRPAERRKGYAKKMLYLVLKNAKKLGLEKVMVCCDFDNIASEKTIIANGGVFEKIVDVDGRKIKRYWIDV